MLLQKLEYMHANPVTGVWNLVSNAVDYPHSSMAFYVHGPGHAGAAPIIHYHKILYE